MANRFDKYPVPADSVPTDSSNRFSKYDVPLTESPVEPDPAQVRAERLKKIAAATLPSPTGTAIGDRFVDARTFGAMGPVAGAANAIGGGINNLIGKGDDSSFGERYTAGESAYDDLMKKRAEEGGGAGTAASVAGMLTAPGGGRGVATIPRLAAESAAMGGADATLRARGSLSDRLSQGAGGAAVGGATGAVLGSALRMLPGFAGRRAAAREAARGPGPEDIRQEARNFYGQLDNAGITYDPASFTTMPSDVARELQISGYNPRIQSGIGPLQDELHDIMRQAQANGGAIPFQRLQQLRTMASDVAGSQEPGSRRLADIFRQHIDDFVQNTQPSQGFMSGPQAAQTWQQARHLWNRASKTEDLLYGVTKAERRAAVTNSGSNVENKLRQNMAGMLDKAEKPGRYNPYTDEESQALTQASEGTRTQNALRAVGNTFGGSGFAPAVTIPATGMAATQLGLTPAMATAGSLGLFGLGKAARSASARMAENRVDDLARLFSTGSTARLPQPPGPPRPISMLDALAQRGAAVAAPTATTEYYSGGW